MPNIQATYRGSPYRRRKWSGSEGVAPAKSGISGTPRKTTTPCAIHHRTSHRRFACAETPSTPRPPIDRGLAPTEPSRPRAVVERRTCRARSYPTRPERHRRTRAMGLWDKIKHELIDIVEFIDPTNNTLVHRFERF